MEERPPLKLMQTADVQSQSFGRRRRRVKRLKTYAVKNANTDYIIGYVEEVLVDIDRKIPGRRWVEERWKAPRWQYRTAEGHWERGHYETRALAIDAMIWKLQRSDA